MQILGIIQKIRNNGRFYQNPDERFKELDKAIKVFSQNLPFVGRIITQGKNYGGRIEKLWFKSRPRSYLKFTITDCNRNGQSYKTAKTYREKVFFENLIDIDVFQNQRSEK